MFEVDIIFAQELSSDIKNRWDVDVDDDSFYIVITNNKETIFVMSDYMEPEDASFVRNLEWVQKMLLKAFELGRQENNKQVIRSIDV